MKRAFGDSTYTHIVRIISGSNDPLSCAPEPLMIRICSMLDLQSVSQLSQVNRYLRRLCTSDKLWSILYAQHQGNPTTEISFLAGDIGWMKVFYMSKLQLQKELSRRRSQNFPRMSATSEVAPLESRASVLSQHSPRGSATSEKVNLSPQGSTGPRESNTSEKLGVAARGSATSDITNSLQPNKEPVAPQLTASENLLLARGSTDSENVILPPKQSTVSNSTPTTCKVSASNEAAISTGGESAFLTDTT